MEQIHDTSISEMRPYQGLSRFFFCFSSGRHKTSCCCSLFTLRSGIYSFAILDAVVGMFNLLVLFIYLDMYSNVEPYFWVMVGITVDVAVVIPAFMGIRGANKTIPKLVAVYYHAKVIQTLLKPLLRVFYTIKICDLITCESVDSAVEIVNIVLLIAFYVYQAHIFYSYVNLVCKGEDVLANNGREVAEAMEQYKRQAAVLELNAYPGVVMGAALQPSAVEVETHVESVESKPTPNN
eukprot:TRINITY_DN6737_c0_g1_i1.p1 TRINITY_DN6737_c0_g1~~TRINITY_DN6737_c0_g1_i1.p1  ORF type:complete len:237 (+),score=30.82 TRINITY_DN6737_c0_g1_i1:141-851(+)